MVDRPSWTFDEHQRCDDCGFDPGAVHHRDLAPALRAMGDRWVVFVDSFEHRHARGDELLHGHSVAGAWSAQEYGRHLRDRLLGLTGALERCLASGSAPPHWSDEIDAEPWPGADGDDPDVLVGQITAATDGLAGMVASAAGDTGEGSAADRIARYALHEGYHHLAVAERAVAAQLPEA